RPSRLPVHPRRLTGTRATPDQSLCPRFRIRFRPRLPHRSMVPSSRGGARLLERIGDGVAIVPAAPELLSSRDTDVPYRPSSDLYYLTGFRDPGALAVISGRD